MLTAPSRLVLTLLAEGLVISFDQFYRVHGFIRADEVQTCDGSIGWLKCKRKFDGVIDIQCNGSFRKNNLCGSWNRVTKLPTAK